MITQANERYQRKIRKIKCSWNLSYTRLLSYDRLMKAETLIEELRKLPPEEIQKIGTFIDGFLSNLDADQISAHRAEELISGTVNRLSHSKVPSNPVDRAKTKLKALRRAGSS